MHAPPPPPPLVLQAHTIYFVVGDLKADAILFFNYWRLIKFLGLVPIKARSGGEVPRFQGI